MYNLEDICNPTMKEYYLMTILDLEDGLELEVVEKAVEDLGKTEGLLNLSAYIGQ